LVVAVKLESEADAPLDGGVNVTVAPTTGLLLESFTVTNNGDMNRLVTWEV
jgi:hypothetical protein